MSKTVAYSLIWVVIFTFLNLSARGQHAYELAQQGDLAMEDKQYALAVHFYKKALGIDEQSKENAIAFSMRSKNGFEGKKDKNTRSFEDDLRLKIAHAYRLNANYKKAVDAYKKVLHLADSSFHFYYAQVLMNTMNYVDAINVLKYLQNQKNLPEKHKKQIPGMQMGSMKAWDQMTDFEFTMAIQEKNDPFKQGISNFALRPTDHPELYQFSSMSDSSENFSIDIYQIERKDKQWKKPSKPKGKINTELHEVAGSSTSKNTKQFFTAYNKNGQAAIYMSNYLGTSWLKPKKLKHINLEGFQSKDPYYIEEDSLLYFASNQSGEGGFDLFYAKIDRFGNTDSVVNLGKPVNSEYDEITPFYVYDTKTMYYSSNKPSGFGGYDIYRCGGNKTAWSPVTNLGFPINSGKQDVFYITDSEETESFLSSDRNKCDPCNGYCHSIFEVLYFDKITIKGYVYNDSTKEIIPNSLVMIEDINGYKIEPIFAITDDSGHYVIRVEKGKDFKITGKKSHYFNKIDTLSTIDEEDPIEHDIYLTPIPEEEIIIKDILYDYDKWDLRPISKERLMTLVTMLEENPDLRIELASHTDERGSDTYNQGLSQKRAESCVKFLVSKGISPDRMKPKGYGESKLLIKNAKTSEEHQKNRRTTFRVLGEDEEVIHESIEVDE